MLQAPTSSSLSVILGSITFFFLSNAITDIPAVGRVTKQEDFRAVICCVHAAARMRAAANASSYTASFAGKHDVFLLLNGYGCYKGEVTGLANAASEPNSIQRLFFFWSFLMLCILEQPKPTQIYVQKAQNARWRTVFQ